MIRPTLIIISVALAASLLVAVRRDAALGSSCSGYYNDWTPPSTIRIYHNNPEWGATYTVWTRDFKTYVKESLAREWIASWPMSSLQAGAVAVRNFGWWWVNGGPNGQPKGWVGGQCYDVVSTVGSQVWGPGYPPDFSSANITAVNEAVDSVWNARLSWNDGTPANGRLFETTYKSGIPFTEACGQFNGGAAPGYDMSQWGTKACGDANVQWERMHQLYYFSYPLVSLDEAASATGWSGVGNNLYVAALGRDAAPWYKYYSYSSNTWSLWSSLGGVCTAGPPAIAGVDVYISIYVMCRGTEGSIWYRQFNGSSWGNWASLGGDFQSGPAATAYYQNGQGWHLQVYALGRDGQIWEKYYNFSTGQWFPGPTTWQAQGGGCTAAPGAMGRSPDLMIFCRGTDNAVWYKRWNGSSWAGWFFLGGAAVGGPAATFNNQSYYEVLHTGTDAVVYRNEFSASSGLWTGWTSLGGINTSMPGTGNVQTSPNRFYAVARGRDDQYGDVWLGSLVWVRVGPDTFGRTGVASERRPSYRGSSALRG